MPILGVEFVGLVSRSIRTGLARRIADAAAEVFDSRSQGTWVKLRFLDEDSYSENHDGPPLGSQPTFVSVLQESRPPESELSNQASRLSIAIANASQRPIENIHIAFEPSASGRVSFGGKLRT